MGGKDKNSKIADAWRYTYSQRRVLGKGGFSIVYEGARRCKNDPSKTESIAVKRFPVPKDDAKQHRAMQREITLLRELKGAMHIVTLFTCFVNQGHMHMCMERCDVDLHEYIMKRPPGICEETIRIAGRQLGIAIEYLHGKHIVHRDIKPKNVLLMYVNGTPPGVAFDYLVKLSDFGLATFSSSGKAEADSSSSEEDMAQTWCGSPLYMAPEMLYKMKYDQSVDLYAFGAVLYQMRTRTTPVRGSSIEDLRTKMPKRKLAWPSNTSSQLRELCTDLLSPDPFNRPEKVTQHPFFRSARDEGYVVVRRTGSVASSTDPAIRDACVRHDLYMCAVNRLDDNSGKKRCVLEAALAQLEQHCDIGETIDEHRTKVQSLLESLGSETATTEDARSVVCNLFALETWSADALSRGCPATARTLQEYYRVLTIPVKVPPRCRTTVSSDGSQYLGSQLENGAGASAPIPIPLPTLGVSVSPMARFCYNCGSRFRKMTTAKCAQCGYQRYTASV